MKKLLMIVLLLGGLPPLTAQPLQPDCDMPAIQADIGAMLAEAEDAEDLSAVQGALSFALAECRGWVFKGGTERPGEESRRFGPLTLDKGAVILVYSAEMMRYGELDIQLESLGETEYIEPLYEFRTDVDNNLHGEYPVMVQGGRYMIQLEASNTPAWSFFVIQP